MTPEMNRPLSPHLQIYRPQITSVLSITHRFTGIALVFGAILLFFWLTAASLGAEAYSFNKDILTSWIGKLVMFGVIFSVWFHLGNGIRHLAWDAGFGFKMRTVHISGIVVLTFSIIATTITIIFGYIFVGNT